MGEDMTELLKRIIVFFIENWIDILMIAVGSVALLIYWLQNRKTINDAASLIVLQIDELQDRVREISSYIVEGKLNETAFYESLPLMQSNHWDNLKHYFVRKMDSRGFNTINIFYEYISAIQEQQLLMKNLQKNSFFLTQNVLVNTEANFIISSINNASNIDIDKINQILMTSIPSDISDKDRETFESLYKNILKTNEGIDTNLFWKLYRNQQSYFTSAINGKALTLYIPEQIKMSLEKILVQYSMLEVSGSEGYLLLKKISKRWF